MQALGKINGNSEEEGNREGKDDKHSSHRVSSRLCCQSAALPMHFLNPLLLQIRAPNGELQ